MLSKEEYEQFQQYQAYLKQASSTSYFAQLGITIFVFSAYIPSSSTS